MVWSDIYPKTINLAIVAIFLYFISLTIAQSTTVKTIENNEFLEVSICISSLVTTAYQNNKMFWGFLTSQC